MSDPTPQTHYLVRRPTRTVQLNGLEWGIHHVDAMSVLIGDRCFVAARAPESVLWRICEPTRLTDGGRSAVEIRHWDVEVSEDELSFCVRLISSRAAMDVTDEYLREELWRRLARKIGR